MKKIVLIFLISFFHMDLSAKIRLLTFHFNKPDYIELQYHTFKKFMKDDYELIVFNDAIKPYYEIQIKQMCEKYGIRCVRYPQKWHKNEALNEQVLHWLADPKIYSHIGFGVPDNILSIAQQPSIRHCHVIQYAMDQFGYNHDDIVAIVDGDVFPIRPVSLREYLKDYDIVGIQKLISTENVDYLWVPFIAFDVRRLPDKDDLKFHVDIIENKLYDTGAHTYHYLRNHPEVRVRKILGYSSTSFYSMPPEEIEKFGFKPHEIEFIKTLPWPQCVEIHMDQHFLHFGASSFGLEGHDVKSEHVKNFLNKICKMEF